MNYLTENENNQRVIDFTVPLTATPPHSYTPSPSSSNSDPTNATIHASASRSTLKSPSNNKTRSRTRLNSPRETPRRQIRARRLDREDVPQALRPFLNNSTPGQRMTPNQVKMMFDSDCHRCIVRDCPFIWWPKRIGLNFEHVSQHLNHRPYQCSIW